MVDVLWEWNHKDTKYTKLYLKCRVEWNHEARKGHKEWLTYCGNETTKAQGHKALFEVQIRMEPNRHEEHKELVEVLSRM